MNTLHQSALLEILPMSSVTKTLTNYDIVQVENNVKLVKAQKERILQDEYNILLEEVDIRTKRSVALAREKETGSW